MCFRSAAYSAFASLDSRTVSRLRIVIPATDFAAVLFVQVQKRNDNTQLIVVTNFVIQYSCGVSEERL